MICTDPEIIGPWVYKRVEGRWCPGRAATIGKILNGEIIAGVAYEDFTGTNVVCHIAGEKNWATPYYLAIIFDYPFRIMGVKRITVPVASNNAKSIKLVEKMGFKLEAKLTEAIPAGDLLIYRMFKNECKYLGRNYGKKLSSTTASA